MSLSVAVIVPDLCQLGSAAATAYQALAFGENIDGRKMFQYLVIAVLTSQVPVSVATLRQHCQNLPASI